MAQRLAAQNENSRLFADTDGGCVQTLKMPLQAMARWCRQCFQRYGSPRHRLIIRAEFHPAASKLTLLFSRYFSACGLSLRTRFVAF